jgi:predicted phage tail protein
LPFFVECIPGSRSFCLFFVELGAAMIVASTIVPPAIFTPLSVGGC